MVTESEKYRAQLLQILGLSFMAPTGKLYLNIPEIEITDLNLKFLAYITVSLLLVYLGIICIVRGIEILEGD